MSYLGFAKVKSVPARLVTASVLASVAVAAVGIVQGWPAWAVVAAALVSLAPTFLSEVSWTQRHYGWLALFYVLVVTQAGHVVEHVVQVTQIHVLSLPPKHAHGVFGALDIEWVHFAWNSLVLAAVLLLFARFRGNPWLWVTLAFAGWHEVEHAYMIARYIATGVPGDPGLAAMGGVLAGGLPLSRPDLHFLYNVIESTPLVAGFVYQLRRTYDAHLARALPRLTEDALTRATQRSVTRRYAAGDNVFCEGDFPRSLFVVVRGELDVVRGRRRLRRTDRLGPGELLGESELRRASPRTATVRARTTAELLEIDRGTFLDILRSGTDRKAKLIASRHDGRRRLNQTSATAPPSKS